MRNPSHPAVLLLDPFPDERLMFEEYLNAVGFHVTPATPPTAVACYSGEPIDVVIVRTRPHRVNEDGVSVATAIRGTQPNTPIILLTTNAADCNHPAFDRVLLLPALPDDIADEIRALIRASAH